MIERFRVRAEWRGRVLRVEPDLLSRAAAARANLAQGEVNLLGPYLLGDEDAWLTLIWQFSSRAAAARLEALVEDPLWKRYVESELVAGPAYHPADGSPGF